MSYLKVTIQSKDWLSYGHSADLSVRVCPSFQLARVAANLLVTVMIVRFTSMQHIIIAPRLNLTLQERNLYQIQKLHSKGRTYFN